tara:strand:+ start:7124 stop:7453 length:330 start_codon:yes stop_codon:yes gene_type:complete
MTDNDPSYGKMTKRVVFTVNDHVHAKFLVKLKYAGFKQSQFFRLIMDAYIDEDDNFLAFIDKIKPQSQKHKNKSKKLRLAGTKIANDMGLNEGEIENIFDILEQEFPDL